MKVKVLRVGHRVFRDKRLTTHVALIARALGAQEIVLSGEPDNSVISSVDSITARWGGPFKISYEKNWKKVIESEKRNGTQIIHLTMYGIPFEQEIEKIKKSPKPKLIVVGSEKVPGEVYSLADYNLAVTNQPHSEAGGIGIFLYSLFSGKTKKFKDSKLKIVPQKCGKKTIKN